MVSRGPGAVVAVGHSTRVVSDDRVLLDQRICVRGHIEQPEQLPGGWHRRRTDPGLLWPKHFRSAWVPTALPVADHAQPGRGTSLRYGRAVARLALERHPDRGREVSSARTHLRGDVAANARVSDHLA